MKKIIVGTVIFLALVSTIIWEIFNRPEISDPVKEETAETVVQSQSSTPVSVPESTDETSQSDPSVSSDSLNEEVSEYPKITTEVVNGRTERTIHMGVRQWVWEPSTLRVKQGELVRLVIHNADVNHPLYIPELGIEAEVPPEGAVVEFEAKKEGSFFFLCGTYCGEGHAEMQGTLIIE